MTTTTTQTAKGQVSIVTMVKADGNWPPSLIHLPDATTIFPNADGSLTVSAQWISDLQRAGWGLKTSSSATSVPSV